MSKDKAITERPEQSADVKPDYPNVNWKQILGKILGNIRK